MISMFNLRKKDKTKQVFYQKVDTNFLYNQGDKNKSPPRKYRGQHRKHERKSNQNFFHILNIRRKQANYQPPPLLLQQEYTK